MTKIIGITGRKGSGKDTLAQAFINNYGAVKVRFADPLKAMLASLLLYQGVDDEKVVRMIEGDLKEVPTPLLQGKTPRHAMQTIGTEWGRNLIGDKIWIDAFLNAALQYPLVVCSDLRFENEYKFLKDFGAYTIRVESDRIKDNEFSMHPSETFIGQMQVDLVMRNDGTLETFNRLARDLAHSYYKHELKP